MFLTLTPAMHQLDSRKHEPGPIDHVTLNLAVESLSYHFVSGDKLGPLANVIKAASLEDGSGTSPPNGVLDGKSKVESPTFEEKPSDRVFAPSAVNPIDDPVLPPAQNDKQDTVVEKGDTVAAETNTTVTSPPNNFASPATVLKRRLVETKDLIVCPGVYDGFSARIALSVGFDALYMVHSIPS